MSRKHRRQPVASTLPNLAEQQKPNTPCARGCTYLNSHIRECETPEECAGCKPRPANAGPLCRRCEYQLLDAFTDAPAVYADLAEELRRSGQSVEGHGTPSPPCIDPAVADTRENLLGVLRSWLALVCDERSLTRPADGGIGTVCLLLVTHHTWIVAQPWADECASEVLDALRQARWQVQPSGRRRFPVAPCTVTGCTGTLIALVADTDSLLPSELVCNADDEHRWSSDRWVRLGRTIHVEDVVDAR